MLGLSTDSPGVEKDYFKETIYIDPHPASKTPRLGPYDLNFERGFLVHQNHLISFYVYYLVRRRKRVL